MLALRKTTISRLFIVGVITAAVIVVGGWFVVPRVTSALSIEPVGNTLGLASTDLVDIAINVVKWALGFVSLVAVSYLIYGGYLWLTAAGNEQRVEKAKQVILQAVIGIVIIILAWAIVLFAARTASNVTSGSNTNSGGGPPCPLCTGGTFNLTAVTSCSAAPNYADNVPRSSAISMTFNTDVDSQSVKKAVEASGAANNPKLQIEFCGTDPNCGTPSTPKPLNQQIYSGATTTGAQGSPKQEWVASGNTVTFYHLSFSTDPASSDNQYFEAGKYYRLTIPRHTSNTALLDMQSRVLENCGDDPLSGIVGDHCDTSNPDLIRWTFQTGSDTDGPALQVTSTQPSSTYLVASSNTKPDRNIPRNAALNVSFSTAIDPASVSTANFRVYKFTTPPDPNTGNGGVTDTNPLDPATFDIRVSPDGRGAWLQLKTTLFESFTWYKVVVEKIRNLCGTAMANPYTWVFETSDAAPGVAQVYPSDQFSHACPSTKVFIQYTTSMWKVGSGSFNCSPSAAGSYVTNGAMSPTPAGRGFTVVDQFNQADPYNTCKMYSFTPESANLTPGTTYHVGVDSSLVYDANGTKLNYGDTPPASTPSKGPWSFTVDPADKCYQPPVITAVQPNQGQAGQCVSVIGDYFLKPNTTSPGTNDKLTLGSQNQAVQSGAWNRQSIVSKVDATNLAAGQSHPYQVTVDYGGQIGLLKSNAMNFLLNSGTNTNGVCLYSLNPNQGQTGSGLVASGEGFGSYVVNQSKILASPSTTGAWPISSSNDWTATQINNISAATNVPVGQSQITAQISVQRSDGATSNALPFTVQAPTTGTPTVEENASCDIAQNITPSPNPRRGDTEVCKNALVSARFTMPMDLATLTAANITLRSCTSSTSCTNPVTAPVNQLGNNGFTMTPNGGFGRNTLYEVTISTGVKSDISVGNKPMASPYTWQFKTADTNDNCPVAGVTITPAGPLVERTTPYGINGNGEPLTALTVDQSCRVLNPGTGTFTWSITSSPHVADLQPTNTSSSNVATDPQPGPPDVGSAQIKVAVATKTSAPVTITYDPTSCQTSADCAKNRYGETCGGSQCVNNHCTPVVNGVDPTSGSIGTWTTVKGCWFSGYDPNKSKVTFLGGSGTADDRDGVVPSTTICGPAGSTWENERIITEVPKVDIGPNDPSNDAATGPVQVTRDDGKTAASTGSFTVNTTVHPGLCRIVPDNALPNASITINGIRFGPDEPAKRTAQDQANLTKIGTSTPVLMTTYTAWSDTGTKASIDTAVPATAGLGDNEARVKNDGQDSNPWPFHVNDPNATGPGSCPAGQQCFTDNAANCTALGLGCGLTDQCCHAIPTIVSFQPPQNSTNVCRNIAPQVTLSQPLDPSTVNTNTIRYYNGNAQALPSVGLDNQSNQSTITVSPGVLSPGAAQELDLTTANSAAVTVDNPSFENGTNGVPDQWGSTLVKQSTDVPPGHSGVSALGDCSACTGGQAFAAQNIPGTSAPNITYHLTGWVKAEVSLASSAGLITRCSATGNGCGYDLGSSAPGLFDSRGSNGWVKIDVIISKTQANTDLISIDCFANAGSKIWCDDISLTRETGGGTLLRSDHGVLADVSGSPLKFTAGTNICTIDHVGVTQSSYLLTAVNQLANPIPRAYAYSQNGWILQNLSTYSWDWSWLSGNSTIATATMTTLPNSSTSQANVTAKANGQTTAQAKAKVTFNSANQNDKSERTGQSDITVSFCNNPWIFKDDVNGTSCTSGTCNVYNYQMFYCRDQSGSALLPDFSYKVIEGVNAADPTRLKSYFFKESQTSRDTIGVLIFKNDALLSPSDWFAQRFPLETGAASATVNGYPAVKTGTTTYVGVTNNTGTKLQGLMFVFDYNSNNASDTTKNIYGQIIDHLLFNRNDNSANRQAIINDTKRGQDLASVKVALDNYKTLHGGYPKLDSGTYLPGYSTSAWPSWQSTLGQTLNKSLSTDPSNDFAQSCPTDYAASTCWSEANHAFQCPDDSHVYLYHSDGSTYSLYGHMEYTGAGGFANTNSSDDPCSSQAGSNCGCFNYKLTGS